MFCSPSLDNRGANLISFKLKPCLKTWFQLLYLSKRLLPKLSVEGHRDTLLPLVQRTQDKSHPFGRLIETNVTLVSMKGTQMRLEKIETRKEISQPLGVWQVRVVVSASVVFIENWDLPLRTIRIAMFVVHFTIRCLIVFSVRLAIEQIVFSIAQFTCHNSCSLSQVYAVVHVKRAQWGLLALL